MKPPEALPLGEAHAPYLKDASFFSGSAEKIFFPVDEAEVCWIVQEAARSKTPLTISGAGSGLTGARVPQGGWVLSTERMNKVLSIEERAVVQPGVPLRELEKALEAKGLFYPPNPGEKGAFLGGTIATNASGSRSFKYGPTRRWVRRLKIVLPNGDLLDCARGQSKAENGFLEVSLSGGETVKVPVPSYRMPACKNAAGYFAEAGMDLIDLFIGAEGTLGVIVEAELAVLKKPEALASGVLFFPNEKNCFSFSQQARKKPFEPRVMEFLDSCSLTLLLKKHPEIPEDAQAALFFEQECAAGEAEAVVRRWREAATSFHGMTAQSWFSANDPKRQNDFRVFRYDLPVSVNELVKKNGFRKVATDMAVPAGNGEAMFDYYLEALGGSELDYCLFGHLGENHLHANLLPKSAEEFAQAQQLYETIARKAVELGGTVSAEHGIGKLRIPYLEILYGEKGLLEMARVKKALDPAGILNPGNIVPAGLLASA